MPYAYQSWLEPESVSEAHEKDVNWSEGSLRVLLTALLRTTIYSA